MKNFFPRPDLRPAVVNSGIRFAGLAFVMLAFVAFLAVAECAVLRALGYTYTPKSHVRAAAINDFQPFAAEPWGASRISYRREHGSHALVSDILVHDLRRPGHGTSLNVSRLAPMRVAASPNGDWLAFVCGRSHSVYLYSRVNEGRARRLMQPSNTCFFAVAFSPDGRLVAAAGLDSVCLWHAPTGEFCRQVRHEGPTPYRWIGFSGDSRTLLSASHDGSHLWDVSTGELRKSFSLASDANAVNLALSPSGNQIAYTTMGLGYDPGEVHVMDVETGAFLWRAEAASAPDLGIAFSADGVLLAAVRRAGQRREIVIREAQSGAVRAVIEARDQTMAGLAFGSENILYSWDRGGIVNAHEVNTGRLTWRFSALDWAEGKPLQAVSTPSENAARPRRRKDLGATGFLAWTNSRLPHCVMPAP
jgi:WD40 repeat protein